MHSQEGSAKGQGEEIEKSQAGGASKQWRLAFHSPVEYFATANLLIFYLHLFELQRKELKRDSRAEKFNHRTTCTFIIWHDKIVAEVDTTKVSLTCAHPRNPTQDDHLPEK